MSKHRHGDPVQVDIPLTPEQLKLAEQGIALGGVNTVVKGWIAKAAAKERKKKRRRNGRTNTTIERDLSWLEEKERDYPNASRAYFASIKGVEASTMRHALGRAEKERKKRESSKRE